MSMVFSNHLKIQASYLCGHFVCMLCYFVVNHAFFLYTCQFSYHIGMRKGIFLSCANTCIFSLVFCCYAFNSPLVTFTSFLYVVFTKFHPCIVILVFITKLRIEEK